MTKQARKHEETEMKEDTRIALLEQSIEHVNESLRRIEDQFKNVYQRFDMMDNRFDEVNRRFDRIDTKVDSNFKWLLGIIIASFAGTVVFFSHVVHLI